MHDESMILERYKHRAPAHTQKIAGGPRGKYPCFIGVAPKVTGNKERGSVSNRENLFSTFTRLWIYFCCLPCCLVQSSLASFSYLRFCFRWLLNVPATCECISGTDLLRQFYVLPHRDRSCRSNFPSHPVTVYWHRADQSQHWPYNAMRLAG